MKTGGLLIMASALVVAGVACSAEPGAPARNLPTMTPSAAAGAITITKVTMYRDNGSGEPGDEVTVFKPADRVMHFLAKASGLRIGQNVNLVFTAVDTIAGRNIRVAEADAGKVLVASQITGTVSLDRNWPVGSYTMDIYVDGSLVYTWKYTVEG